MEELRSLIHLNLTGCIGYIRFKTLLDYFTSSSRIVSSSKSELMKAEGITSNIADTILRVSKEDVEEELKLIDKYGVSIIDINHKDYPRSLTNIYSPPILLYVKGRLLKEDELSVAVVGSRKATYYGLSTAERFSYELSSRGITIVSGMARGIDTASHKGVLKAGGRTIAVLGSGLACIYPPENKGLSEEIARNGAVISEFPMKMSPNRINFPRRNRIVSGLSLGVVVVEVAEKSGALITADLALEQGKDVFAVPGEVKSDTSIGANNLIKQGAKLVDNVDDILEELNIRSLM